MKTRKIFRDVILILTVIVLAVQDASAPMAAHRIIDADNRPTTHPIAVDLTGNKTKVRVFLPVNNGLDKANPKGFFVIQARKRLPRMELELRMSMNRWKRYQEMLKEGRDYREGGFSAQWKDFYADVDRFERIACIEPETHDGVYGIFLDLEIADALRTYVVHDFLPWGGVMVRDGGLWLTYDIPSIVDTLLTKGKSPKVGSKDSDQFRIQDVLIEEEKEGSRTFRVQIKKLSAGLPDLGKLGIKLRIWERSPSGSLVLANAESLPEWDTLSLDWKDSKTEELLLAWKGPAPGDGNTYYGFSADIIYDNRLQHSWSTAPELLTHLLAVEPLASDNLKYYKRPIKLFQEAMGKVREIREGARQENRQSDVEELNKVIKTLEMLATKYPEPNRIVKWHPGTVSYILREARTLLSDLSTQESKGASPAPGQ